jgi:hypothetical protein
MTDKPDTNPAAILARWREAGQAATEGPWTTQKAVIAGIGGAYVIEHGEAEIALVDCAGDLRVEQELADAEFICAARTALPLAIGALERLLADHQPGRIVILGSLCRRHANYRHFSITATEAEDVRACLLCAATAHASCTGCGGQVSADACPVRGAITRELTGKDGTDEQG